LATNVSQLNFGRASDLSLITIHLHLRTMTTGGPVDMESPPIKVSMMGTAD